MTQGRGPVRGDVWLVRLPRARGVEVQEDRPAAVVSSDVFASIPLRIVVPLMSWRSGDEGRLNKVRIRRTAANGLERDSSADVLQVKSVSTERLIRRIGSLEGDLIEEIAAGIVIAVDYETLT